MAGRHSRTKWADAGGRLPRGSRSLSGTQPAATGARFENTSPSPEPSTVIVSPST
jgi:hypothetical protein